MSHSAMYRRVVIIARYTLLEARRTRLPGTMLLVLVLALAGSFFVREISIAEGHRLQTAFYSSVVRLAAVFVIALHVLGSISREFQDKGLELLLALDVPRSHYILGRLAGFLCVAALMTTIACMPQFLLAEPGAAAQWSISLALELSLVASLGVFCIVTFTHVMPAATFMFAFYLLARTITAIRLISEHPLSGSDSAAHAVVAWVVRFMSWMLPPLDDWTRTAWLVDAAAAWRDIGLIAGAAVIYLTLLAAATMFDFYRRPL